MVTCSNKKDGEHDIEEKTGWFVLETWTTFKRAKAQFFCSKRCLVTEISRTIGETTKDPTA